jgi:hypothetical protein
MEEQRHDIWLDRDNQYSLEQFHSDLAEKIIWGPSQTLAVWVLDQDTGSEWKLRRDEHVHQMIKDRWDERLAFVVVDVVNKHDSNDPSASRANEPSGELSRARCVSGVTSGNDPSAGPSNAEGYGDTCSSPPPPAQQPVAAVDWATLTILENPADDGTAAHLVDEDQVYEAMGFQQADPTPEQNARTEVPIPPMTAEMEQQMNEAAVNVDDTADEEPLYEWDRDNPDLSVGVCYPSIGELRLAVKQHAIKKEFELRIEHSDTQRYRVYCGARGCPWKLRARTQHDGSCRVHFPSFFQFL